VHGDKGMVVGIILMWLFVFVAWAIITAMVITRLPSKWPREAATWEPGQGKEGPVFLLPTLVAAIIGIVFVAIFISPTVNFQPWPNTWGTVFGIATAILFVAAEFFNIKDPLVEWFTNRQLSLEHYLQLEKDIWLLLGGAVIFVVLCAVAARGKDQVFQDQGWQIAYILSLVLMGFGSLRGVARGAIRMIPKWQAHAPGAGHP